MDIATWLSIGALALSVYVAVDTRLRQRRAARSAVALEVRELARSMLNYFAAIDARRTNPDAPAPTGNLDLDAREWMDIEREITDRPLRAVMRRYSGCVKIMAEFQAGKRTPDQSVQERTLFEMIKLLGQAIERCGEIRRRS